MKAGASRIAQDAHGQCILKSKGGSGVTENELVALIACSHRYDLNVLIVPELPVTLQSTHCVRSLPAVPSLCLVRCSHMRNHARQASSAILWYNLKFDAAVPCSESM